MHPLKNRNFRLLLASRVFASLSISFLEIPIFWWLIKTTGSGSIVAAVAFVSSIAYILASPLGGVFADRGRKKPIIMTAYALDASLTALAAYLLLSGNLNLYVLLILLAITNLATAFRGPSLIALQPQLIDKNKLQEGNASMGLASSLAMLLSAALAGIATSILGPAGAIFFGAGLIFLALFTISFLKEPSVKRPEPNPDEESGEKPGIWAGIDVLKSNPLLATLVIIITLLNFIASPLNVLFAPYVIQLGADVKVYGLLSASLVFGNLLGMLLLNFVKIKKPLRALGLGTFALGLGLLALALAPHQIFSALSLVVMGLVVSILNIAAMTIFQERISPDLLGRVMGLETALSQSAQPAGYVLAGVLLTITTARISIAGMGITMAFAALLWLRPAVKHQFNTSVSD